MGELWAPVSEPTAEGRAGWQEHESIEACLDLTSQGMVVVAVDTAVTKTQFLLLDPYSRSHRESPEIPTKGPRELLRTGGWATAGGMKTGFSATSSLSAWIHHCTSAQPLIQDPFIPQTLSTCSAPGPQLGSTEDTVVTKTILVLSFRDSQSSGRDRWAVTTRAGRAWERGAQGAVRVLTQSERVKGGFLEKETSEMCRTISVSQVRKGETCKKAIRKETARHSPRKRAS